MEELKEIDLEDLETAAGGNLIDEEWFSFRMQIYRGETHIGETPCAGRDAVYARTLRICVEKQYNAEKDKIHIYLPDGTELNYNLTFKENNICGGLILKAVIVE